MLVATVIVDRYGHCPYQYWSTSGQFQALLYRLPLSVCRWPSMPFAPMLLHMKNYCSDVSPGSNSNVFRPGMNGRLANVNSLTSLTDKAYMVLQFQDLLEKLFFALIGNTPLSEMERVAPETVVTAHLERHPFSMDWFPPTRHVLNSPYNGCSSP